QEACWICHSGTEAGYLERPCRCPRSVHPACLARWQLASAGRAEERNCRFCQDHLPDWKEAHSALPKARSMSVVHEGSTHQLAVHPGPQGRSEFEAAIRRIFGLAPDATVQLTFGCRLPDNSGEVTLEGSGSFDAAVHLAAISAGQR
ncbi:hypothetical protein CHLNCDRAFT_13478, partial [Chlorella variabilis]